MHTTPPLPSPAPQPRRVSFSAVALSSERGASSAEKHGVSSPGSSAAAFTHLAPRVVVSRLEPPPSASSAVGGVWATVPNTPGQPKPEVAAAPQQRTPEKENYTCQDVSCSCHQAPRHTRYHFGHHHTSPAHPPQPTHPAFAFTHATGLSPLTGSAPSRRRGNRDELDSVATGPPAELVPSQSTPPAAVPQDAALRSEIVLAQAVIN